MKSIPTLTFFVIFLVLFGCTENLRPQQKTPEKVITPVHYSLSDTTEQVVDSNEQQPAEPPKIVHKALCRYSQLSVEFDFALSADVEIDEDDFEIISKTYVKIISKTSDSILQKIQFDIGTNTASYNCIGRSYSTKQNLELGATDGFWGDIVVADLNFDGKEDIAIARGFGYTMFYNYYLQNDKKQFVFNEYLSGQVDSFPYKIDPTNLTFETTNRAGVRWYALNTYKYDPKNQRYKQIRHQSFDAETGELEYDYLKEKK